MMPLWNMKGRTAVHWDGLTTSFHESMLSSGIGNGASRKSIGLASLGRLEQWLMELPSPRYPLAIDAPLAASGEPLFAQHCASCHAPGGARTGSVVPIGEIGTDAHRVNMWTEESAAAFNAFADGYPWDFKAFRKTNGYVAVPLDGVWLRGAVSPQRFGPVAARPARAAGESPEGVLSRLRPSRPCTRRFRVRRPCCRAHRHTSRHRASGKRERRPPVRHRPHERPEARPHRVFENALRKHEGPGAFRTWRAGRQSTPPVVGVG